jgi:hypothetical protein
MPGVRRLGMKIVRSKVAILFGFLKSEERAGRTEFFSADRRLAQEPDARISEPRIEWQDS